MACMSSGPSHKETTDRKYYPERFGILGLGFVALKCWYSIDGKAG